MYLSARTILSKGRLWKYNAESGRCPTMGSKAVIEIDVLTVNRMIRLLLN
jgi:hypothetical protein